MARTGQTRRPRTRAPEDKRARVVAAARALFRDHGYGSTTTAQIARAAGVSEGTVFHHFGNKQGVLAAVAAEHGRELATAMFAGLLPGDRPDVRRMIEKTFDFVRRNGHLQHQLPQVGDPAEWTEALHMNRAVIIGALAAAFEQWAQRGLIRTDRPRHAAVLCFGLVESALVEVFGIGDGSDADAYLDEAVRLIEDGLHVEGREVGGGADRA